MLSIFETMLLKWNGTAITKHPLPTPYRASVLRMGSEMTRRYRDPFVDGSGKEEVLLHLERWEASPHAHTSRAVLSAFCDALRTGAARTVGGVPQLVGLQGQGPGRTFGVVFDGLVSIMGSQDLSRVAGDVVYRNELFERDSIVSTTIYPLRAHWKDLDTSTK
jgi:hypothetical protein